MYQSGLNIFTFSVAASVSALRTVRGTPKLLLGAKAAAGAANRREASASFMIDNFNLGIMVLDQWQQTFLPFEN